MTTPRSSDRYHLGKFQKICQYDQRCIKDPIRCLWCALRGLVPFVQFKKREKHPWKCVTFSYTLLKVTLLHGCFSRILNCTNGTKSRNASHLWWSLFAKLWSIFAKSTVSRCLKGSWIRFRSSQFVRRCSSK